MASNSSTSTGASNPESHNGKKLWDEFVALVGMTSDEVKGWSLKALSEELEARDWKGMKRGAVESYYGFLHQAPPPGTSLGVGGAGSDAANQNQKRSRNDGMEPSEMHKLLMEINTEAFGDPSKLLWLPFPMLGDYPIPERFASDDVGQFPCLGREIFPKLLVRVKSFIDDGTMKPIGDSPRAPPETHNTHQVLRRMLIYGNTGAGKSHLLMLLGISLRKEFQNLHPNMRVVIVPSALNIVYYKLDYLLAAVRLACAGHKEDLAALEQIEEAKALGRFCGGEIRYLFIVDQAQCLEVVKEEEDARIMTTTAKEARDMLADVVGHRNFVIYGSSANNDTAKQRFKKQQDILFYDIFGGFSKIEMENWLNHICKVKLSDDQKDQVLLDTGAVPLFLTWFWPERNANLVDYTSDDVRFADHQHKFLSNKSFVSAIAHVDSWVQRSSGVGFDDLASAFLLGSALPSGFSYDSYDNRYFYVANDTCHTVSGFVKKQLALSLRRRSGHAFFLNPRWLDKVQEEASSPTRNNAVLGFLAEQAVISTIATGHLVFRGIPRQFKVVWFEKGDERKSFPAKAQDDVEQDDEKAKKDDEKAKKDDEKAKKDDAKAKKDDEKAKKEKKGGNEKAKKEKKGGKKEQIGTLLLPTAFNYPNVDAVFSCMDNGKPMIVGVQVTLQKYKTHQQAATNFTNTAVCQQWLGPHYANYEWYFLWVMPAHRIEEVDNLVMEHPEVVHKTRNRSNTAQQVAFKEHFSSFGQMNPTLDVLDKK